MLGWIWTFLVGIVVGALARWLLPGPQPMGWIMTGLLGVAGSFAGGFIFMLLSGGGPFKPAGFIVSVIGAILLLVLARMVRKKA